MYVATILPNVATMLPNKECSLHKEWFHLFQRSENLDPVSVEENRF